MYVTEVDSGFASDWVFEEFLDDGAGEDGCTASEQRAAAGDWHCDGDGWYGEKVENLCWRRCGIFAVKKLGVIMIDGSTKFKGIAFEIFCGMLITR